MLPLCDTAPFYVQINQAKYP